MGPGDIVRQRKIRAYADDSRNFFEFVPDREKDRSFKRVFVCLVLGTEGFEITDRKGEKVMASLDMEVALNRLGWWSELQIEAAARSRVKGTIVDRLRVAFNKKLAEVMAAIKEKKS